MKSVSEWRPGEGLLHVAGLVVEPRAVVAKIIQQAIV